jgi:arylsulfatase A-like enzyme
MTAYKDIIKNVDVEEKLAKKLIHAYYACVSYIDAQIGRVLTALDELGLAEDTIVILTSDHGFSLSEHNRWSKHSLFKTELQVPLMIKVPGLTKSSQSDSFAELVDLYPTICELLNIKGPKNLQGNSLVENLNDPNKITKTFAFSRYINGDTYMSNNFFYSEWKYNIGDKILDRMIYENHLDPLQMNNLSHLESYNVLMDSLGKKIDNQIIDNQ